MFRGVINLGCVPEIATTEVQKKRYRDRQKFSNIGRRVDQNDIYKIVSTLFSNEILKDKDEHTHQTLKDAIDGSSAPEVQMMKESFILLHEKYR